MFFSVENGSLERKGTCFLGHFCGHHTHVCFGPILLSFLCSIFLCI